MEKLILCVRNDAGGTGERLLKAIRDRFPNVEQENHTGVEALCRRLCFPDGGKGKEIVIVQVDNNARLERLTESKECFDSRRLVLVLQEESREILSKCHLLRPRYISREKNRHDDLLSVLCKMMAASNQQKPFKDGKKTGARRGPKANINM